MRKTFRTPFGKWKKTVPKTKVTRLLSDILNRYYKQTPLSVLEEHLQYVVKSPNKFDGNEFTLSLMDRIKRNAHKSRKPRSSVRILYIALRRYYKGKSSSVLDCHMNTVRSVKQKFNGKDFLLEQLHKRIKRRKELLADGTFVLCEDCGTDAHKDELVNMGDHLVCESCYKSEIDPTYEYENDE